MTIGSVVRNLEKALPMPGLAATGVSETALKIPVAGIVYDSRKVNPGSVFVALRGMKSDGRMFADQAIAAGAVAVVAEQAPEKAVSVPWIVVSNTRVALACLATEYHGHPSSQLTVVGITGTNGKTTTSYLLSKVFEAAGYRCGLMGTVTYRIGGREFSSTRTTPEAPDLQGFLGEMVRKGCDACAMEVSSHALALHRVSGTRFSAGVFTNLGRDHLDFHLTMEAYFSAKKRLFEMLPNDAPAAVNIDDPRGSSIVELVQRPVTYAIDRPADVTPGPITSSLEGLSFNAQSPQGVVRVRSKLLGRANVYNLLSVVGTATALGLPRNAVEQGIESMTGVPGRFESVSSFDDDIPVFVDYAHTDDALRHLLETARPLTSQRLITVFGCGGGRDRTKRPLMGMVAARLSDLVVITSDNPRNDKPVQIIEEVVRGAQAEVDMTGVEIVTIVDRKEAIHEAVKRAQPGDIVVITGKGHEKFQEINDHLIPFDDVLVAREALTKRRGAGLGRLK